MKNIAYILLLIHAVTGAAVASILFEDDFANGSVANSKTISSFWSGGNSSGNECDRSESGGALILSVGSSDDTSGGSYDSAYVYSAISNSFNFFSQPILLQARGISFDDHSSGMANSDQMLRFWFGTSGSSPWASDDNIVVRIKPSGEIRLGAKQNDPSTNTDGVQIGTISVASGETYGLDLMLAYRDASSIYYRLVVYTGVTPVEQDVILGFTDLNTADWGTSGRHSKIGIQAQEANVSDQTQYFSASVTNFTVTTLGNLLTNPGFEDGTTDWLGVSATISAESGTVRSGSGAIRSSARTQTYSTFGRYIETIVITGATYRATAYGRLASGGPSNFKIQLRVNDQGGDSYLAIDSQPLTSTDWTLLSGEYTVDYEYPLGYIRFYFPATADTSSEIIFDDISLTLIQTIDWTGEDTINKTSTSAWATVTSSAFLDNAVLVWGRNDEGTVSTNDWPNRIEIGAADPGTVTTEITGLEPLTPYVWRIYGQNGSTNAWSAATAFTSDYPIVTASLESKDSIVGASQSAAPNPDYYPNAANSQSGLGGSVGSNTRINRMPVLGFKLPRLPAGATVIGAILNYEITGAVDQGNNDPSLDVYLLDTSSPDGSGTNFFYQGASDPDTNNKLVGSTYIVVGTSSTNYPDDTHDQAYDITGDALTLLQSLYGNGDNSPHQAEAFFRFNMDVAITNISSSINRYYIDLGAGESSLIIKHTIPDTGTVFRFK